MLSEYTFRTQEMVATDSQSRDWDIGLECFRESKGLSDSRELKSRVKVVKVNFEAVDTNSHLTAPSYWMVSELLLEAEVNRRVSDVLAARIAMRLIRDAGGEAARKTSEGDQDTFNGLFARITLLKESGTVKLAPESPLKFQTPGVSSVMEILREIGAEFVPLSEFPPDATTAKATFLISFSPVSPNAGRIKANDATLVTFIKSLGIQDAALPTESSAKRILNNWASTTETWGLPVCGLCWRYHASTKDRVSNPFPSFEFDLLAKAFTQGHQKIVIDKRGCPDCEDLESPVIGKDRSIDCALALHFVATTTSEIASQSKNDESKRKQVEEAAILSSVMLDSDDLRQLTIIIPEEFHYGAEGDEKSLKLADSQGPRMLKFNVHLSRTRIRQLTDVIHLVLRPSDDTHHTTVYDLIKISKLWAGGEESTIAGSARDQLKFMIPKSHDAQTGGDCFRLVVDEIAKAAGLGDSVPKLRAGTIQLVVRDELGKQAVEEVIQIALGKEGKPIPPEERSAQLSRALLELAGVKSSIIDFEYVDALEIDDTFDQPAVPDNSDYFIGLQKGTLVHFSMGDRAFESSKKDIGISPYLLIPHAVLLHNEKCLFEAQAEANSTLNLSEGAPVDIQTLRKAELAIREKVQQHLLPNIFQYTTEQAIYEFGHENRGLNNLRKSLEEQLKGIDGRLEEEIDKKKYSLELFLVIAGVLIGVGQLMSGWSGMRDLFFDAPSPALVSATDQTGDSNVPNTTIPSAKNLQFLFQVFVFTVLGLLAFYLRGAWKTLIDLHSLGLESKQRLWQFGKVLIVACFWASIFATLCLRVAPWAAELMGSNWFVGSFWFLLIVVWFFWKNCACLKKTNDSNKT